jgi:teichuronic acid biosynthesis glycosyltransferase TuaH
MSQLGTVVLLSADPWDDVWRRNQHLASRLVRLSLVEEVIFICPGAKLRHRSAIQPEPRVRVVTPHLLLPRFRGGMSLLAHEISMRFLRDGDVLWVNDAVLGARCLRPGLPTLYDVTDDWRAADLNAREREHLISAEDVLARSVKTTVCSEVLFNRWFERYQVVAPVIHNGADVDAHAAAAPIPLPGLGPHAVYVGTLHGERLDSGLLIELVQRDATGSVHLVGPDHLEGGVRKALASAGRIWFHGSVPHLDVPRWMASADVLICPHRVDQFTLSLDAIKSFEYLVSGRPVVATPTSGFQQLPEAHGVHVVERARFVEAVAKVGSERTPTIKGRGREHDWSARARQFAAELEAAEAPRV